MRLRFVLDVDGSPLLVLPPRWAAVLEREFGLDRMRVDERGRNPEFDELMASWHAVAMQHAGPRASARGRFVDAAAEVATRSHLTATEAAGQANVTAHAVRLARRKGRLRGELVGERWMFDPAEVTEWANRRSTTR